jgi:UDP-N-acetylglucosamine:LPS N-acetylglucosamine transferase
LLKLAEIWNGYETFCVTTTEVVRDSLGNLLEVYVVGECNRQHQIRVIAVLLRCIRIIFKERPDVVISTGAAAGCMLCFLGKIIGAKVV